MSERTDLATAPPQSALTANVQAGSILGIIARAATDPAVDVVKMQALLDMQERILARQAEAEFNAALVRLTTDMPRVRKSGLVDLGSGKGRYNFARWEDMDAIIRPLMQREGFTLSFDMAVKDGGGAVVTGTLLHAGGHTRQASVPLALDTGAGRNNLQAMGSTMSYGKRYVTEMLLNIVREGDDDDGRRGGMKFISPEQRDELLTLLKQTGREESVFLERLFDGAVRSFDEIEEGQGFVAAKNLLQQMLAQQRKRADTPPAT